MKKYDIKKMVKEEVDNLLTEDIWSGVLSGVLILQTLWLLGGKDIPAKASKLMSDLIRTGSLKGLFSKLKRDRIMLPILKKLANDPEVQEYIKTKGRKGIRKFITPKLSDNEIQYVHKIYGKDIEAIMDTLQTEGAINEESMKRFVATMEFYVWGANESAAKIESENVVTTIRHKYDNDASVTGIVPQQFGKMGIGENITESTKEEKLYELVGNLFKLFGDMKYIADDFYEKVDSDKGPLDIFKSFTDKKSRSIILRYFTLNKKLKNIPIEEIKPHIERWMAEHEDEAADFYSGQAASDLLKTMGG